MTTVSNAFRVGAYTCELTYADGQMSAEWRPHMPPRGSLTKKHLQQYRAGRDALIAEIAKMIGGNVLTIEI